MADLTGTREEMEALDTLSRQAEAELRTMAERLTETNHKLDSIFAERERLQKHDDDYN